MDGLRIALPPRTLSLSQEQLKSDKALQFIFTQPLVRLSTLFFLHLLFLHRLQRLRGLVAHHELWEQTSLSPGTPRWSAEVLPTEKHLIPASQAIHASRI